MKIKQKIKDWLFADELKDIQQIKKEYGRTQSTSFFQKKT